MSMSKQYEQTVVILGVGAVQRFRVAEVDEQSLLAVVDNFGPRFELDEAHCEIEVARQRELLACLENSVSKNKT